MANCKPIFPFFSMIIFTTFLFSVTSQQSEVSFSVSSFTPGDSLFTLQGSASILTNGNLGLINRQSPIYNTGRALYSSPVRIWDNNGNAASFETSFSFVAEDIEGINAADGIIFFLSPSQRIPTNSSGGKLGVVNPEDAFNNFVGVELDNFVDRWDPNFPHIGIDVNSLYSLQLVRWNRISGSLVRVNIRYDAPLKNFRVTVSSQNGQISSVSQIVDLTIVLPEIVYIGLSATTSLARQLINVRSWSFTSTFGSINNLLPIIEEQK